MRRSIRLVAPLVVGLWLNSLVPGAESHFLRQWDAHWITHPDISREEFGVYLFQKEFELEQVPDSFVIHVSADNRYKLYVNGNYVCNGPARGDTFKWRFETVDVASHLKEGSNLICAKVWNFAEYKPVAQISVGTGLIVMGDSELASALNTNREWTVFKDPAYSPIKPEIPHYFVVGPGERFDGRLHPWGWRTALMEGEEWKHARELNRGVGIKGGSLYGHVPQYQLSPRGIPLMEETAQRFGSVRRGDVGGADSGFVQGEHAVSVPPHTKGYFLLDQGQLTTAYPVLTLSGGDGSLVRLTYAESLFNPDGSKGNRSEVEGKEIRGFSDEFISDGGALREVQSLWWRTFRYVRVEVETGEAPLRIDNLYSIFTAYPFRERASFSSDKAELSRIWDVGWHTQRLCAGETYFDCPYYEQLQYVGDTRIQCLISYYVSGDDRLMRRAVGDYFDSRQSFKLTQSRYPSNSPQIIPPFSLYWIVMVHDYWMLRGDSKFVQSMIPGILDVLQWYEDRIGEDDLLGYMEWWNFVDWVAGHWRSGTPPGEGAARSTVINLEYVYAIQSAADLFRRFGMDEVADHYVEIARRIHGALLKNSWDDERGLLSDTPDKEYFSQHANLMGVLTGMFAGREQEIMERVLAEEGLAPCSYYYRFYLTEAMRSAGMGDRYVEMLYPWTEMLDNGLSTFAENPDPTRSDCHAWSSSPLYHYLSLICGIRPGEPGFRSVKVEPHLGELSEIEGRMPHPLGEIVVHLEKMGVDGLRGQVVLPEGVTGVFTWRSIQFELNEGENDIRI